MAVTFRNYTPASFFTDDYLKVRNFLIRVNQARLTAPNFTWGRWEWMITHGGLDQAALGKIGLWEDSRELVALATYESSLGDGYFIVDEQYGYLKADLLEYALTNLAKDGGFRALIDDQDREFQRLAHNRSFFPTQDQEHLAALEIDEKLAYQLLEGFRIVSMADGWDYLKYNRVMWRGFNHQGEAPQTEQDIGCRKQMLSSPMILPELVLAVVAPDGNYVAHCGMWYRRGDDYALVEPVATDPTYRLLGLGKAAVIEAVRRCGRLGAKQALVGSSQQFYYAIGFCPIHRETWWAVK